MNEAEKFNLFFPNCFPFFFLKALTIYIFFNINCTKLQFFDYFFILNLFSSVVYMPFDIDIDI